MSAIKALFNDQLPELIAFDLDGTLIDSALDIIYALNQTLRLYGVKQQPPDKIIRLIGRGARQLITDVLKLDPLNDSSLKVDDIYRTFLTRYQDELVRTTAPYPGVIKTLEALSALDIPLAVITNKPKQLTEPLLIELNMTHYFAWVLSGDSLNHKKPHPEPLLYTACQVGATVENCLMVGDSSNDIEAAHSAHFKVIAVNYGYNHGQPVADSNPDLIIEQFSDLL